MVEEPDEPSEKEVREELVKRLKVTRPMFFAFIPKGTQGQLVVCLKKSERDEAANATRKDIAGDTPLKGVCTGPLNEKVFTLDKKYDKVEKLCDKLEMVVKRTAKLSIAPSVKIKGARDEEEED